MVCSKQEEVEVLKPAEIQEIEMCKAMRKELRDMLSRTATQSRKHYEFEHPGTWVCND